MPLPLTRAERNLSHNKAIFSIKKAATECVPSRTLKISCPCSNFACNIWSRPGTPDDGRGCSRINPATLIWERGTLCTRSGVVVRSVSNVCSPSLLYTDTVQPVTDIDATVSQYRIVFGNDNYNLLYLTSEYEYPFFFRGNVLTWKKYELQQVPNVYALGGGVSNTANVISYANPPVAAPLAPISLVGAIIFNNAKPPAPTVSCDIPTGDNPGDTSGILTSGNPVVAVEDNFNGGSQLFKYNLSGGLPFLIKNIPNSIGANYLNMVTQGNNVAVVHNDGVLAVQVYDGNTLDPLFIPPPLPFHESLSRLIPLALSDEFVVTGGVNPITDLFSIFIFKIGTDAPVQTITYETSEDILLGMALVDDVLALQRLRWTGSVETTQGFIDIYRRSGNVWTFNTTLKPPDSDVVGFGMSIAISYDKKYLATAGIRVSDASSFSVLLDRIKSRTKGNSGFSLPLHASASSEEVKAYVYALNC